MKNGDIVFFKAAMSSSAANAAIAQFKGHGFGVLLGHVPPMQRDPQPDQLLALIGSIGFLSFDDIAEFCGVDTQVLVMKKFEEKYFGNPKAALSEVLEAETETP